MTTTTMDLPHAPTRADRRTPGEATRPLRVLTRAGVGGTTARGRPPPAYYERFVHRVMWALFATALLHAFGRDLAAWVWRAATG